MVQSSGRMFPRDGVGEATQVLLEYPSFLYGSVNLISGMSCPVCACVLPQIRVEQRKQFGVYLWIGEVSLESTDVVK